MNLGTVISGSSVFGLGTCGQGIGKEASALLSALGRTFQGRHHEGVR